MNTTASRVLRLCRTYLQTDSFNLSYSHSGNKFTIHIKIIIDSKDVECSFDYGNENSTIVTIESICKDIAKKRNLTFAKIHGIFGEANSILKGIKSMKYSSMLEVNETLKHFFILSHEEIQFPIAKNKFASCLNKVANEIGKMEVTPGLEEYLSMFVHRLENITFEPSLAKEIPLRNIQKINWKNGFYVVN